MKKNLLIVCFLTFVVCIANSQNVPNGGFDTWVGGEPDSWLTNNYNAPGFPIFVTQVSPGHSGTAAKGEVMTLSGNVVSPTLYATDITGTGFAVTQAYANLSFYYKFNQVGGDAIFVTVYFTDAASNLVGTGFAIVANTVSNFTLMNVPIVYTATNATKCTINFQIADTATSNSHLGSYYVIDDVALTGSVGISEISNSNVQFMTIQPNPASDEVSISYSTKTIGEAELSIIDLTGKEVIREKLNDNTSGIHTKQFDVSTLKEGLYLCNLKTSEGSIIKRLQVKRNH